MERTTPVNCGPAACETHADLLGPWGPDSFPANNSALRETDTDPGGLSAQIFDPIAVASSISGNTMYKDKVCGFAPLEDISKTMGFYLKSFHELQNYLGNPDDSFVLGSDFHESVIFVSFACEVHDDKLVKVGIAILDTKNLEGKCMGFEGANWYSRSETSCIKRQDKSSPFFGPWKSEEEEMRYQIMKHMDSKTGRGSRKVVLVGHDLEATLNLLDKVDFMPTGYPRIIDALDIQRIHCAYQFETEWSQCGPQPVTQANLYRHDLAHIASTVNLDTSDEQYREKDAPTIDMEAFFVLETMVRITYFANHKCTKNNLLTQCLLPRNSDRIASQKRHSWKDLANTKAMVKIREARSHGVDWRSFS